MQYIVGLGNPGNKYIHTRHNAGWWVLDAARECWNMSALQTVARWHSEVCEGSVKNKAVMLCYPTTFMNNSGAAVRAIVPKGEESELVVVYDDIDLPQGIVRVSFGNGAGGHNGVASIIERLGTKDFIRVRVGIAVVGEETGQPVRPSASELAAYVLATATPTEREIYTRVVQQTVSILETIIDEGKAVAMNMWN